MSDTDSVIYTDTYKTKDLIWEYYAAFLTSYNNYINLEKYDKVDPLTMMTLDKYAVSFYDLIRFYFDEFKKQLSEKSIKTIMCLFKKDQLNVSEYKYIRSFFGKFMHVTGISKVSLTKEDPREAVTIGANF